MFTKEMSSKIRSLHEDEDGIAALEVVMLTAIAAVIILGLWFFGGKIVGWCSRQLKKVMSIDADDPATTLDTGMD